MNKLTRFISPRRGSKTEAVLETPPSIGQSSADPGVISIYFGDFRMKLDRDSARFVAESITKMLDEKL